MSEQEKLFQDILGLEKDYKYKILMLKLKEEEIERCNLTNKTLQDTINKSLDEVKCLKGGVHSLEEALSKMEQKHEVEKGVCEDVINKLTMKLNEVKGQHKVETERAENEMKRRFGELDRIHAKSLDEKNKSYMNKIGELQGDLQESMSTITRLNTQIQQLMDDSMRLQNTNREMESRYIPEMTIYKNEVNLLKASNADLNTNLETLKKDRVKLSENLNLFMSEHGNLQAELNEKSRRIDELEGENSKLKLCNNKLTADNCKYAQQNADLYASCEQMRKDKYRAENEIENIKAGKKDCRCNEIQQQNMVLQEIVKSLRKERDVVIGGNKGDFEEAEKRIERVENLLEQLKKSIVENSWNC